MGRKRTIDREATMTAIEAVILRDGAGGLSIDAVAREAGISKSSVVYDFRNKAGLLAAFMQNRMDAHREQIMARRATLQGPDAFMRAVLHECGINKSEEELAGALMLAAAARSSDECHNVLGREIAGFMEMAQQDAANERATRLAFVALHGLQCLEYFSFVRLDPQIRQELVKDIASLLDAPMPDTRKSDAEHDTDPLPA
ncbi:TetR/AcrR family transcriptional regulator [Paracoccus sp. DMF-8]|uniref:TetR/AcrR family transcriptional regulator n=1 Tax=Paracoccus sp. DMF-8 TaxID=3019445 RepID=UPI0023E7E385|nr:TetR/AcrR family transcriptional regulator [Paracoccus sp. DMF-8]MDF3605034.1 TetR/AcrR family transcriptional regulator [Paracoccus sp. DMF-8]